MSALCPNGHASGSTDYCDVCGMPMGVPDPAPAVDPGAAVAGSTAGAAAPEACPHCGAEAASGALFCENCGYDFTTGSLPDPVEAPSALSLDPPTPPGRPAPAAPSVSDPDPTPGPNPGSAGSDDPDERTASGTSPAPSGGHLAAPPVPGPDEWVVEIWIDPDWYTEQQAEDPMPSAGLPGLVVLRERSVLVGRPSVSRGIHPLVDCGADTGVSRRHCQLTTDGQRWWVEDLQSSNGTYVSPAGEALPSDPVPPGQRQELGDGDRIYVGAWTRLVVRKALPGEV